MGFSKRHLLLLTALLPLQAALPCTTVALTKSDDKVVGKTYDWSIGSGMVVANLRGLEKTAFGMYASPAKWTSKYGSLSFNQHGRELPLGGVNEKGLTVETMWLSSSRYPGNAGAEINELQWIQYQLDNSATVAEALANAAKIDVISVYAKVHYLICDASGACATFEYLDRKLVTHSGASLPVSTLTNDTYENSLTHLKTFDGFGGRAVVPTDNSSLSRFVRASALADGFDPKGPVYSIDAIFSILDSVGGTPITKFQIAYRPQLQRAYFRTYAYNKTKIADLNRFSLDCGKTKDKTMIFDMNQNLAGDVTAKFQPYTLKENRRMIDEGFKDIADQLPDSILDSLAEYPSTLKCK